MKVSLKRLPFYLNWLLCIVATTLFAASATADIRGDAESAVANLQQDIAIQKFPDDMKSLELVFEVAKRYFLNNDGQKADKFYLLALQKAQIIESMLKMAEMASLRQNTDTASTLQKLPDEATEEPLPVETDSYRLVGSRGVYTVVKYDTVRLVAAKLGVTQQHLRSMNGLDAKATLRRGQKLVYNNLKIIPQRLKDGIIVNIPDRTLYYFQRGSLVTSLPVALGSPTKNEKYVWQTPVGKFRVTAKIKNPTWTVPPSIQTQMEENGKEVIISQPPGPNNPLGKYAIRTSIPGILIHSTTSPSSIYTFSSHGCIRLSPSQMEEFFPKVRVNTRGEIIYKPVKLAVTENGRVFLEVHRDTYKKRSDLVAEAKRMVEKQNLSKVVDWEKFKTVVRQKNGIAEDISL